MCKRFHDFKLYLIYVVKDGTGPKYKKYIKNVHAYMSKYSILYYIILYSFKQKKIIGVYFLQSENNL